MIQKLRLTSSLIWEVEGEVEEEGGQEAQSGRRSHLFEVAHEAASQGWG